MARLLRILLQKVPPVQRQLNRIADLEVAVQQQQAQLDELGRAAGAPSLPQPAAPSAAMPEQIGKHDSLNILVTESAAQPPSAPQSEPSAGSAEMPDPPPVQPYTFQQLLDRDVEECGLDLVLQIHIPKAGGNTVNQLFGQMGFTPLALDMNSNDFFQAVREDRWWAGFRASPPRTAYFLTGHMRLDNPIYKRLWVPHVIVTLLRDPIERMLSNYNFTLRRPHNPWHDDVVNKGMTFLEYAAKMDAAIGPQYGFFDDTGEGTFARTGTASVEHCLNNLLTKIGVLGLTSRFDEFAALAGILLGRERILSVSPINVTDQIPDINGMPLKTALTDHERAEMSKLLKDDIWFYEQARKEYDRRIADPNLQAVLSEALPLIETCRQAMARLSKLRDPRDPSRRAFQRS